MHNNRWTRTFLMIQAQGATTAEQCGFDSRFLKPACVSDAGLSRISPLIKLMTQHNVEAYCNMRQCHRYLKSGCLPSRAAESLRQERRMYGLPHLPSSLRLDRSP